MAESYTAEEWREHKYAVMQSQDVKIPLHLNRCDICGKFLRQVFPDTWRCVDVFYDMDAGAWEHG